MELKDTYLDNVIEPSGTSVMRDRTRDNDHKIHKYKPSGDDDILGLADRMPEGTSIALEIPTDQFKRGTGFATIDLTVMLNNGRGYAISVGCESKKTDPLVFQLQKG